MFSFTANNIIYTISFPTYPACLFVDHYVLMKGKSLLKEERLFPNNKAELFINFGDTLTGKANNGNNVYFLKDYVLSGIRNTYFTFTPGKEFYMAGLRFTLFGFYHMFKIPSHQLRDQNYDASDILGKELVFLRERIFEMGDNESVFNCLNGWVESKISMVDLRESQKWKKVEHEIKSTPLPLNKLLSKIIGYSHKHSIALFNQKAGISPKMIQKINRFDQALQILTHGNNQGEFLLNYSDQSHFIREFKSFSGYTPGEYLRVKPKAFLLYQHVSEREDIHLNR